MKIMFSQTDIIDVVESGKARFTILTSGRIEVPFRVIVQTFDFPSPNATGLKSNSNL